MPDNFFSVRTGASGHNSLSIFCPPGVGKFERRVAAAGCHRCLSNSLFKSHCQELFRGYDKPASAEGALDCGREAAAFDIGWLSLAS